VSDIWTHCELCAAPQQYGPDHMVLMPASVPPLAEERELGGARSCGTHHWPYSALQP